MQHDHDPPNTDPLAPDRKPRSRALTRPRVGSGFARLPRTEARTERSAVSRVSGEVLEHGVPVARRLPAAAPPLAGDQVPASVVNHYYAAPEPGVVPERFGLRWDRLAAYAFGLFMLALVVFLLVQAGVLDLNLPEPPWQSGGSR